jgi:phosphate starvation-inducible PhoH-like protein
MPRRKKDISDESKIVDIVGSIGKTKIKVKNIDFSIKQKSLLKLIFDKKTKIVFISGPAGTSKTFMAIYGALQLFNMDNNYSISYVRTIIESADRGMGALPGHIDEKFDPFMMPLNDKLYELISASDISMLKDKKIVSAMPINYLRGANWTNQIVVADESQNFSEKELVTLITRIGENTKLFICGDPMQSDINGKSGFNKIRSVFHDEESAKEGIHSFEFNHRDIKRSEILKFIIKKLNEKNKRGE